MKKCHLQFHFTPKLEVPGLLDGIFTITQILRHELLIPRQRKYDKFHYSCRHTTRLIQIKHNRIVINETQLTHITRFKLQKLMLTTSAYNIDKRISLLNIDFYILLNILLSIGFIVLVISRQYNCVIKFVRFSCDDE